jgi:hypothetical protein
VSAYSCAGQRAYHRAGGSTFHAAFDGRIVGCKAARLNLRELPAFSVVAAELIEILTATGQRHDARPRGDGCARAEQQQSRKR